MKHLLRMLSKTAMSQKALMLAACVVLGSASAWAAGDYAFVAWDEASGTLYFDCYLFSEAEPNSFEVPTVGATWTTHQGETITVSKVWRDDEVLDAGETPGWVTDDIQNACVKVVIGSLGDSRPKSLQKWFYNFKNLTSIEGLTNLKTRDVKSMASMFEGCAKLTSLELIGLDTRNVEDMTRMFSGCAQLSVLYLSTFDTSKLRYIEGMFTNCTSLKTIYVDESLWTTDNVLDGANLFGGCTSLVGGNKYAYNEASTGLSYAHVDKSNNPGYLTIGSVFAGWNGFDKELTFGFGDVPKLNAQNDEGVFQKIWYGKEVIDRDWATDEVQTKCTKVYFATSFNRNAKGLNMSFWFDGFSNLETVARIEYAELGNTDYMFCSCGKLSSISLPSTLKRIGDCMFIDCSSLTQLFIPKGVTSIGKNAFWESSLAAFTVSKDNTCFTAGEDGVLFNADKTTLLMYPYGKTDKEYTVPNSVQTIGQYAFMWNTYLWYVTLPSSVTAIGDNAFFHCENLEYVRVYAKTPLVINEEVFYCIGSPCWLYVPNGSVSAYKNAAGWDKFSHVFGFSLAYAIWDEKAKTLYFDTDHTEEAPEAGSRWLTSSGRQVNVTKVWSGDEVEKTGSEDNPGWCQEGIMDVCKKVVFEGHISPDNCHGWFYGFDQLTEIEGLHYLLTTDVMDMSNMFSGCSQLRLDPKGLMRLDTEKVTNMSGMFNRCSQLTELYLGSFNTSQVFSTSMMFCDCTNLKTIYVDDSWWDMQKVTESSLMFYGCKSLKGGNGTSFDDMNDGVGYARVDKSGEPGYLTAGTMFVVWCEGNSTLTFDFGAAPAEGGKYGGNTATKVYRGNDIIHFIYKGLGDAPWGGYEGDERSSCTRAVITSSFAERIKGIDMSYWFEDLRKLVLVQGLENVEVGRTNAMFYYCRNLSSITLPATLKEIGWYMFMYCYNLSSIVIPDGVTTIEEHAFYQCESLTSINIPAGVTTIGENAFGLCKSLAAFSVDAGSTHFASVDGVLFNADKTTLVAYPMGNTATDYTIPKGVQKIGYGAFNGSPLTSVSLPSSLIAIDNYAFFGSGTLSTVKSYAKTPPIKAKDVFGNIADNAVLYVLRGCKSAYESAGWNSIFKNIVEFDMLPGDANGDGEVNAQDIVAVSNYIAGVSNVNIEVDAADVTGDGVVNIADVVAIVSLILSD